MTRARSVAPGRNERCVRSASAIISKYASRMLLSPRNVAGLQPCHRGLRLITTHRPGPVIAPWQRHLIGQREDRMVAIVRAKRRKHRFRGIDRGIQQPILFRDAPHRKQATHDDSGIEKISQMVAFTGGRGMLVRKNAQRRIPCVLAQESRGEARPIEILFLSRGRIEKHERGRGVSRDLG